MDTTQTDDPQGAAVREFLSFRNGAEEYGIEILKVQEIRGFESPTRIAGAPPHILGVLNLRGIIVPIMDMRIKIGVQPVKYDHNTVTIVLNIGKRVVGVVVDAVSDGGPLAPADITPPPQLGGAAESLDVIGLGSITQQDRQRMLILLDADALVDADEDAPVAA